MRPLLDWLRARADNVAVALLAAMFISFMVQIASRYVFNTPVAWTLELCLTTWLWVVFWEAAFLMRDGDHIRFDLLYLAARGRTRRTLALLAGIAIIVAFIAALPARDLVLDGELTWDAGVLEYHVFDIPWLDGEDLMSRPLVERRTRLDALPLDPPLVRVPPMDDTEPWERARGAADAEPRSA